MRGTLALAIGAALAAATLFTGASAPARAQTDAPGAESPHTPCGIYSDAVEAKKELSSDHVTYCFGRPMKRDEAIEYVRKLYGPVLQK
jgi:hypothetical protein